VSNSLDAATRLLIGLTVRQSQIKEAQARWSIQGEKSVRRPDCRLRRIWVTFQPATRADLRRITHNRIRLRSSEGQTFDAKLEVYASASVRNRRWTLDETRQDLLVMPVRGRSEDTVSNFCAEDTRLLVCLPGLCPPRVSRAL